jgi:hypothetical protein
MLAVSNTTPISNLACIGRLDLLRAQFGEIRIPRAVEAELAEVPDRAVRTTIDDADIRNCPGTVRRAMAPSETTPVVLADAGVENVNAQVDDLTTAGVLRRVLAFTELKFSNSMIEAWCRCLKHQSPSSSPADSTWAPGR